MYPVSDLYKAKIQENTRYFKLSIEIQHSQGVLFLTDKDIATGSLIFNEASQSGEEFTIGGTVASNIEFSLLNKEEYEDIQFVGATVIVHVGLELIQGLNYTYDDLKQFTYDEPKQFTYGQLGRDVYEYVPLGRFNIDDVDRQRNSIKIKAIDNMIEFEKPYNLSELGYPATLYQIYVDACSTCDVMPATTSFPNMDYVVEEKPEGEYTFRDIIGYVAELAGCFARVTRTGGLELTWYKESGITITASNRFNLHTSDNQVQIKGIMATVDDTTYLAGTDDYTIDLSENPLLQSDYETVLPNIFNNVKDTVFIPYESSWQGNPAMQAGDIITQIDRDGNVINTLITSSTYKYRGASTLKAEGLSELVQGYQGSTNKKIANIVKKEVKPIANKLTDLEQAQLNATQLIASMLGGYAIQGDDAFYVADNPDLQQAQKVWKWGIGGFGYSESGVEGPYTTAITANGSIVAMLVAAGIVTADMVQTGLLQSQDGSTWINLDNGWFNFKDTLKWDGSSVTMEDDNDVVRLKLGNYAAGKYGLLLKDSTGNKTILDEDGILQTWQEGRSDNVDSTHPLTLNVFIPNNTRSINKAILRFKLENFRAYSKGAKSGGNHRHMMMEYQGTASTPSTWYSWKVGDSSGNTSGYIITGVPTTNKTVYTKGASGDHEHDIEYGVYEGSSPTSVTVKVNNVQVGTYTTDQDNIDISQYLNIGQWNTIELGSSSLGRIDATVFLQALMGVS